MHSLEIRTCHFPLQWDTGHFNHLLVSKTLQPCFLLACVYALAVEARAKEQAIVLDLQEKKTVADCGHNADDVQYC